MTVEFAACSQGFGLRKGMARSTCQPAVQAGCYGPVLPQVIRCGGCVCVVTRACVGTSLVECCQPGGFFAVDVKQRRESRAFGD